MVFALLLPGNVVAKKKSNVRKQKFTMNAGETLKLRVYSTKKKVRWSIRSGSYYVRLKNKRRYSVNVYGKRAGRATIRAKYGKTTVYCNIRVKAAKKKSTYTITPPTARSTPSGSTTNTSQPVPSDTVLAANTDVTITGLPSGKVLFTIKNNNQYSIDSLKFKCCIFASDNTIACQKNIYVPYPLFPGGTYYVVEDVTPYGETPVKITAQSYTFEKYATHYTKGNYINATSSIQTTIISTANKKVSYCLKNNGSEQVQYDLVILYYDAAGNVVDADYSTDTWNLMNVGESETGEFDYPTLYIDGNGTSYLDWEKCRLIAYGYYRPV